MLKKIAIFLMLLLLVQMALYARLYANDIVIQVELSLTKASIAADEAGLDHDTDAYLKQLGIQTKVDEAELNTKYPGTRLFTNPASGSATIQFSNPQASNYRLDIYDSKGLVASFVNVSADQIVIDKELFASGAYIYKLSGDSNLYCGTFVLR